jgi:hypothetical protein
MSVFVNLHTCDPIDRSKRMGSMLSEVLLDQQRDVGILFGLVVFCIFDARVPEFDKQPLLPATVRMYAA